jgi:Rps23 Pro-64 3,4-dihydroxylase Tpa1-like proline 4-hydroxylase
MEDLEKSASLTRTQELLTPVRESITNKPPFVSGKLQLPAPCFSLLYRVTKDGHDARFVRVSHATRNISNISCHRHIDLANATPKELEQLTDACERASFGRKQETVIDDTYRKAVKMDSECFSPTLDPSHTDLLKIIYDCLLEGTQSTKRIKVELYKLNVYSTYSIFVHLYSTRTLCCYIDKGSFFKPHVDTPRSKNMFGSLVIVFPTPHKGGALHLRHRGQEWIFDSGQELATKGQPSIGYAAFFSDVEHEVSPVISGYRVTLTYNLYFDDDGPVSADDSVSKHPLLLNEGAFREAFTALLENPEFLPEGGTLAFGLRHVYPIQDDLNHVYDILKGSDAVVYQSVSALGYEPELYIYYASDRFDDWVDGVLIDHVVDLEGYRAPDEDLLQYLKTVGGICVTQEPEDDFPYNTEQVEWVTPQTTFNQQEGAFVSYGNEATLEWIYGDVCLVVRIGEAGDRSTHD